jgi:hypothetical protein
MQTEFALLEHAGLGPRHWDLMIRRGACLATWQLRSNPLLLSPGQSIEASRIADHREAYLDYQGPISGGRGCVRREAGGIAQLDIRDDDWTLTLCQLRPPLRLRLKPVPAPSCRLERLPEPPHSPP